MAFEWLSLHDISIQAGVAFGPGYHSNLRMKNAEDLRSIPNAGSPQVYECDLMIRQDLREG